jgi:hypothetical protein
MKLFIIVLLLAPTITFGQEELARKKIIQATLAHPTIKGYKKTVEKKLYKKLPVSKETATIVTSTALTAIKGEVNTEVIKNMDISTFGGKMRPNAVYNWRNRSIGLTTNIVWTWK